MWRTPTQQGNPSKQLMRGRFHIRAERLVSSVQARPRCVTIQVVMAVARSPSVRRSSALTSGGAGGLALIEARTPAPTQERSRPRHPPFSGWETLTRASNSRPTSRGEDHWHDVDAVTGPNSETDAAGR